MSEELANDLLRGAPKIAEFLGEPVKRVYELMEAGAIPCGKERSQWIASKRKLLRHYDRITGEI